MNKKTVLIAVIFLVLGILAVITFSAFGRKPFAKLTADEIVSAELCIIPPGKTVYLTDEEDIAELTGILNEIMRQGPRFNRPHASLPRLRAQDDELHRLPPASGKLPPLPCAGDSLFQPQPGRAALPPLRRRRRRQAERRDGGPGPAAAPGPPGAGEDAPPPRPTAARTGCHRRGLPPLPLRYRRTALAPAHKAAQPPFQVAGGSCSAGDKKGPGTLN